MVLDGYGLNERTEGNAIAMANTPVMDKLMKECPFVKGQASGLAVGLPDGQMGNSEVGHMNIGAGRIIYQDLTRITKAIADGDFFKNKALLAAMDNCKKNDSDLHLWGLLSDGGVHSHITHLYGLLEMAKKQGLSKVYVHAFLDGRDTPPASGKEFIEELEKKMGAPDFWDDVEAANKANQRMKTISAKLEKYNRLRGLLEDAEVMADMAEEGDDQEIADELIKDMPNLESKVEALKLETLLKGPYDRLNAILSLHAGAGGTEAQDWVSICLLYTSDAADE